MDITETPWTSRGSAPVELVQVPAKQIHAMAGGSAVAGLSPFLGVPESRWLWQIRSAQISADPIDHPWITRLIVDTTTGTTVGLAGFHGPPDDRGMVEIGYRVDPAWQRRGYARAALEILIFVAQTHPRVRVLRATISPDNAASIALVAQYGFRVVGEQWDEQDGLETIYEIDAAAPLST